MQEFRNKVREATASFISDYWVDIAHDIHHLDRVCSNALFINEKENNGNDRELISLASYLHDFHRLCRKNYEDSKFKKVEDSNQLIYDFFKINPVFQNYLEKVIETVSATDKYTFSDEDKNNNLNIVSQIIYDADNLDALGAVGIARAFSFGQWINEPLYNPAFPLVDKEFSHTEKAHSVLHHFYEKLVKLENEFYTDTGKNLAKSRAEFTKNYLATFLKELQHNSND